MAFKFALYCTSIVLLIFGRVYADYNADIVYDQRASSDTRFEIDKKMDGVMIETARKKERQKQTLAITWMKVYAQTNRKTTGNKGKKSSDKTI